MLEPTEYSVYVVPFASCCHSALLDSQRDQETPSEHGPYSLTSPQSHAEKAPALDQSA